MHWSYVFLELSHRDELWNIFFGCFGEKWSCINGVCLQLVDGQLHIWVVMHPSRDMVIVWWLNTLRQRQNGRHFPDNIFTCIFVNENWCILIKFSLKYVRKGPIDNNPALVQIMAWRQSGDKPLSEPMMTQFNDAYMRHSASMS